VVNRPLGIGWIAPIGLIFNSTSIDLFAFPSILQLTSEGGNKKRINFIFNYQAEVLPKIKAILYLFLGYISSVFKFYF